MPGVAFRRPGPTAHSDGWRIRTARTGGAPRSRTSRSRMRRAAERGAEHEKAEGLAIARELASGIARLARGIHVMPMGKYKTAAEILQAIPRQSAPDPRATA